MYVHFGYTLCYLIFYPRAIIITNISIACLLLFITIAILLVRRLVTSDQGSGCGSVGRAVASDTKGPRFESSHRQKFLYFYSTFDYYQLCIGKTKIKKNRPGMAHFLTSDQDSLFQPSTRSMSKFVHDNVSKIDFLD